LRPAAAWTRSSDRVESSEPKAPSPAQVAAEAMNVRIRRLTLLVGSSVALAVAFGIFAGVSDRQFLGAGEVDRFLAGVAGELGSGCALLLARQGKVFYEKSSGGFDARKPIRIASATRWLSGAAIVSLVDEGKITLDDLASRYLPGLAGEASRITVRQLLSHTSGLPMSHPALGERDITLKQAVDAIVTAPLMFPKAGRGLTEDLLNAGLPVVRGERTLPAVEHERVLTVGRIGSSRTEPLTGHTRHARSDHQQRHTCSSPIP